VNPLRHAQLARMLIAACGGLDDASGACAVNVSRLSEYQSPGAGAFMRADVIADLEAYCGQAVYSGALAAERPAPIAVADLMSEACAAAESAVALQAEVRGDLAARGSITPAQARTLVAHIEGVATLLRRMADDAAAAARGGR
jgi:hypothetical protein